MSDMQFKLLLQLLGEQGSRAFELAKHQCYIDNIYDIIITLICIACIIPLVKINKLYYKKYKNRIIDGADFTAIQTGIGIFIMVAIVIILCESYSISTYILNPDWVILKNLATLIPK